MFGKNGPNLPNIGKISRRAVFAFCQTLAKNRQICQTLANPVSGAAGGREWMELAGIVFPDMVCSFEIVS
jgi:hypothetical protein